MRKYHHIGIPSQEIRQAEKYHKELKFYHSGYESSEYGIEWMRFEEDCPLPVIVKTIPHIAFEVVDLDAAIAGKEVIIEPNSPSPGIRVAFIVENGAPVEFIEINK